MSILFLFFIKTRLKVANFKIPFFAIVLFKVYRIPKLKTSIKQKEMNKFQNSRKIYNYQEKPSSRLIKVETSKTAQKL